MNLTLIAAVGKNNELGKNNDLIWHIKDDMKFFRDNTMGKKILMGMNTYLSLPKKLKNREYIILTSKNIDIPDALVFHNRDEFINYFKDYSGEIMVIGGASIYRLFIDDADKILLTEIDDSCLDADVYFPDINNEWGREVIYEDNDNIPKYKHVKYLKK